MAFWNWSRWEQELDWMALHGINLPLGFTGEQGLNMLTRLCPKYPHRSQMHVQPEHDQSEQVVAIAVCDTAILRTAGKTDCIQQLAFRHH